MADGPHDGVVSPFVSEWLPVVARHLDVARVPRRALDLAMGEGRHACALADAGFATFGVDLSVERMRTAQARAGERGLRVVPWAADLDSYPLPRRYFDVLLCTRFLLRRRWPEVRDLVRPGGFVLYETFTTAQRACARGPSSPDHLLDPGELHGAFSSWDVVFHEEVAAPSALARLVARRPAEGCA
jgi:SAM-dependent methyltransferase